MELTRTTQNQAQAQGENDLLLLPQLINAWQQNRDEMITLASQMKEKKIRMKHRIWMVRMKVQIEGPMKRISTSIIEDIKKDLLPVEKKPLFTPYNR